MSEPNESIRPDPPAPAATSGNDIFLTAKRFPGLIPLSAESPTTIPSPESPGRRKKKLSIFVTLALFALVVGGLALVVQFLPAWRQQKNFNPTPVANLFRFEETRARWDPKDENYAKECEPGVPGHYDFPFQNTTAAAAELGFLETSCDCSRLEVALLSDSQWNQWKNARQERSDLLDTITAGYSWVPLEVNRQKGIIVPASANGLVRISWKGRKSVGQRLNLRVGLWFQPEKKLSRRQFVYLEVPTVMVSPVMYTKRELSIGTLGSGEIGKDDIFCWSATRPQLPLKKYKLHPLFALEIVPLNYAECQKLEKKLREGVANTRIMSACHLILKVYEEKNGKQFPQGYLREPLSLTLGDQPLDPSPVVSGRIQGEVEIGTDQGKINLSFASKSGIKKPVRLWTAKNTGLKIERCRPPFLNVHLQENAKESTGGKRSWILELTIPAGLCPAGPLPEDSAIILRTEGRTSRLIRIPVLGSAG